MSRRTHRLIHVVGTSAGGDWFVLQATLLARRGHHLLAVLPDEGPLAASLRSAGVEVTIVRFKGRDWRSLPRVAKAQFELIWLMARYRPTIAHYHLFKAIIMGRIAAWVARVPVRISQWPGSAQFDVPILSGLDRATVWIDDLVVGSCRDIADRARDAGASRTAVIYYGLDTSVWDPSAPQLAMARESVLEELEIEDRSTRLVGMVGYMYPTTSRAFREIGVKGHEALIDAAAHLVKQTDDVHFVIVGDEFAGDGSYRAALERRAMRLGLAHRMSFLGHRHDIARLTRAFDILVVPSMSESASYAAMQSLLLERPVVGTRVGGIPDTVQHGETGVLVEPGSPRALAAGIAELLRSPPTRQAMGQLGRRRVLERFDITHTVEDLEGIYDQLVAEKIGAPPVGNRPDGGERCEPSAVSTSRSATQVGIQRRGDPRMRVLLVGPIQSIHVRRWHDHLVDRGHAVHVFSGERVPDGMQSSAADHLRFPFLTKSLRYALGALQLRRVIGRIAPDVVHVQSLGSNALLLPAVPGELLVVSPWGGDMFGAMRNPVRRALVRSALRRASLVLATSRAMSGLAANEFGASPDRVVQVSWGVDTELFTPASTDARTRIRRSFGVPTHGLLVTAIRTSAPVYRTREVIRAFVRGTDASSGAHLAVVAGFEPNDPRAREEQRRYREDLRREAAAARGSAITFIDGPLSPTEYAELLRASDVAVSVPQADQRSSSVLEALACGTTVLLSDLAPYRELAEDGYHVRIVREPLETELTRWLRQPELLDGREVTENVGLIARTESRPEQFRKIEAALVGVATQHDRDEIDDGQPGL